MGGGNYGPIMLRIAKKYKKNQFQLAGGDIWVEGGGEAMGRISQEGNRCFDSCVHYLILLIPAFDFVHSSPYNPTKFFMHCSM